MHSCMLQSTRPCLEATREAIELMGHELAEVLGGRAHSGPREGRFGEYPIEDHHLELGLHAKRLVTGQSQGVERQCGNRLTIGQMLGRGRQTGRRESRKTRMR